MEYRFSVEKVKVKVTVTERQKTQEIAAYLAYMLIVFIYGRQLCKPGLAYC